MEAVGKAVTWCACAAASLLYGGWVLSVLWGWYVAPVFHLPLLLIGQAIGLNIVVRNWTILGPSGDSKAALTWNEQMKAWVYPFVGSSLSLSLGWIVHFFVR